MIPRSDESCGLSSSGWRLVAKKLPRRTFAVTPPTFCSDKRVITELPWLQLKKTMRPENKRRPGQIHVCCRSSHMTSTVPPPGFHWFLELSRQLSTEPFTGVRLRNKTVGENHVVVVRTVDCRQPAARRRASERGPRREQAVGVRGPPASRDTHHTDAVGGGVESGPAGAVHEGTARARDGGRRLTTEAGRLSTTCSNLVYPILSPRQHLEDRRDQFWRHSRTRLVEPDRITRTTFRS
ncbi:hypothetical protein BHE74_00046311 [Ensete ventricosum]|nr:hypothetical protein GW17_00014058 [Ensete ventricosum]RWW47675.1 hypothetical protein BHE74_00046311 [Ensete ventricosum]